MNTIQLLHRIRETASGLVDLNDILIDAGQAPSSVEKEMLKRKCTELYELIIALDTKPNIIQSVDVKPVENVIAPPPNPPAAPVSVPIQPAPRIKEEVVMPPPPTPETVPVQPSGEPVPEVTMQPELFATPKPKEDERQHPDKKMSLHEKFSAGARDGHLHDRVRDARVESLKTAISLNRKIAFVNELFGENTVEYAKAIDRLNSSTGLNEAMMYFNELKHARAWTSDNELVKELETLIQKRFV